MLKYKGQIFTNDESAIITHYFQNANTKYALPFEKDALSLLNNNEKIEERDFVAEPNPQYNLFPELYKVPFPAPKNPKFTFIDLFAGIGGFRIAMQNNGGKCIYSSEWNKFANKHIWLILEKFLLEILQKKRQRVISLKSSMSYVPVSLASHFQ